MKRNYVVFKNAGAYIAIFIFGVLLLQLIASANIKLMEASQRLQPDDMVAPYLIRSASAILMGMLVKWRRVLEIVEKGFKFNPKLVPGIVLGLISSIPTYHLFYFFRLGRFQPIDFSNISNLFSFGFEGFFSTLFIAPFVAGGGTTLVLSVVAGVLIVEGLSDNSS